MSNKKKGLQLINSDMTVLDVVSGYKDTLPVFKRYDGVEGECISCNSLFETIHTVAGRYGLDLKKLLKDLEMAARI